MVAFETPMGTGVHVTDKTGVSREVFSGTANEEVEHYGLFEGPSLIASLSLNSPSQAADEDCATPFWSVGMIEVLNAFQKRGLGPGLLDAVFALRGEPLASDLDQDGGGADLWRRWIRDHPGEVELCRPGGEVVGIVVQDGASYAPDPWADRETRLVRTP